MRQIICKQCNRTVDVTPQQSHFVTLCKTCFIASREAQIGGKAVPFPCGVCLIEGETIDETIDIAPTKRQITIRFKLAKKSHA